MQHDDGAQCSLRPIIMRQDWYTVALCSCGWISPKKPRRSKYAKQEVAGQWREHRRMTNGNRIR